MDLVPTVGLGHVVGAARVGLRLFSWLRWVTVAFPLAVAVVCWLTWATLQGGILTDVLFPSAPAKTQTVGYQCDQSGGLAKPCFPTSDGTNAIASFQPNLGADKPHRTAGILSKWVLLAAVCASLTAATMWLLTALAGGVLQRGQRQTSRMVGAVKGAYTGVQSDIKKGKADAKKARDAHGKAKGLWAKASGRGEPAGEPVDLEKRPRSTRAGRREAKAEIAASRLDPLVESPPEFGGYASDSELVGAGALVPEVAVGRAAVTGDPYASPAEKREVMS